MNTRPYISPHRLAGATRDWSAIDDYRHVSHDEPRVSPGAFLVMCLVCVLVGFMLASGGAF